MFRQAFENELKSMIKAPAMKGKICLLFFVLGNDIGPCVEFSRTYS